MHIILGGTGNVGSAVAKALLQAGEPVTVVTHSPEKAPHIQRSGAEVAVADVHDVATLRSVFRRGRRLFLLNPPAAPSSDTATEERRSLAAILEAIADSGLEKIVALSTYGAQPGERIGDLGVLYEMEQALAAQPIPATILRAAYYMSNWALSLKSAREQGVVQTFFPVDFALPMVSPEDIGKIAARSMAEPPERTGLHNIEGPACYTAEDVASAFAEALGRQVKAESIPRKQWKSAIQSMGFSDPAAESFANMTARALDTPFPPRDQVEKGDTSLRDYIMAIKEREDPL